MNYNDLRKALADKGLDLEDQIDYLADLRQRCREGILQEKVSAKEGVMQVLESYPAIELQATKELVSIIKYLDNQTATSTDSPTIVINVHQTNDIP